MNQWKVWWILPFFVGVSYGAEKYYLQQSVVSASGIEHDLNFAPGSVSVITQEDLSSRSIKDLGEALMGVPGVDVTMGMSGAYTFSIRGFGEGKTLVLVDGKRINEINGFGYANEGENNGYIPPISMIERIEVIRGGASTLYGSDAIGGVVNIITKKIPSQFGGSFTLETKQQQHYNLYGSLRQVSGFVAIPLVENKLSLALRGRYTQKDPYGLKYPEPRNPNMPSSIYAHGSGGDYSLGNIGARIAYKLDEQNSFYIDGEHYRQNTRIQHTPENHTRGDKKMERNSIVLNHDGSYNFGNLNTYFQMQNTHHKNASSANKANLYVVESKAITPINFNAFGSIVLTSGVQYQYDNYISGLEKYEQNTIVPYLDAEYFITDNLSLTLGARYSYSDLFDGIFIPRAYLVYQPLDWITLKGGVSKGYRAPQARLLGSGIYSSSADYDYYGNPDASPEESTNYEIGVNFDMKYANFSITGFLIDYKNELYSDEYNSGEILPNGEVCSAGTSCFIYTNRGKNQARGIEIGANSASFNGFSIEATYTYLEKFYKGTYQDGTRELNPFGGERIEDIPRHIAMLKLNYKKGKFSSYLRGNGRFDTLSNISYMGKYKDFYTFDLGLSYKMTKFSSISFAVNNLFDQNYFKPFGYPSGRRTMYDNEYQTFNERRNFWISYKMDF